jgi:serine phosphatase RsbU (regulator of sigma subunit)
MLGIYLMIEYRRRNPEAAILIVPTLLAVGTYDLFTVLNFLGLMHVNVSWLLSILNFKVGFLPANVYSVCLPLFWISMSIIILRRTGRDTREKARLASEFDAARNIQQLLISKSATEGTQFQTECIYMPASEVGGDFFQILPGADGSLLVVVGDVSGKGLRAAMTVSMIVGALRGIVPQGSVLRAPGQVLCHLNHVLAGQISGFVTCCAAHISADGLLTLANAGHIPPYCNGKEMATTSGLPLGMVAEIDYQEVGHRIHPGDRLTFISDGVLEATNQQKELFGFERTLKISMEPAYHIAEAARSFGQEDDITVLTVERLIPCPVVSVGAT